ncbi:MAG: hypothetical protein SVX43_18200, partial [Cyanobacteriota bacterium]|nr:hypothetical protein [Cyanobacteriota bacterium]
WELYIPSHLSFSRNAMRHYANKRQLKDLRNGAFFLDKNDLSFVRGNRPHNGDLVCYPVSATGVAFDSPQNFKADTWVAPVKFNGLNLP